MTSDPHSLDDYYEALASLSAQKAVRVRYLTWKVWGGSRVNSHSDTVEHALEELVAQGRADRTLDGKYRARGVAPESAPHPSPPVAEAPDPTVLRLEATETKPGTVEHVEIACEVAAVESDPDGREAAGEPAPDESADDLAYESPFDVMDEAEELFKKAAALLPDMRKAAAEFQNWSADAKRVVRLLEISSTEIGK